MGASTSFMGNEFQSLTGFGEEGGASIMGSGGQQSELFVMGTSLTPGRRTTVWLSGWGNVQGHSGFSVEHRQSTDKSQWRRQCFSASMGPRQAQHTPTAGGGRLYSSLMFSGGANLY